MTRLARAALRSDPAKVTMIFMLSALVLAGLVAAVCLPFYLGGRIAWTWLAP